MALDLTKGDPRFREEIKAEPGGEHFDRCFSCGTCMASCEIWRYEPAYNPRRVLRLAAFGLREEVFSLPTIWLCSACDACYKRCPQGIHISEVMDAIRRLALRAGYGPPPRPVAHVNVLTCVGCGLCTEVCPYEAVQLEEQRIMGQMRRVAVVDAVRCMGCGLCAASCRSTSIELEEPDSERVMEEVWGWLEEVRG